MLLIVSSAQTRSLPLYLYYIVYVVSQLFFSDLTIIDWAHHFINVLIMGIIAECWNWGKGVNATCFFMNGVPGRSKKNDLFCAEQ